MAYALELALGIPPAWGYLVCALVVIPLVTHGVSAISRLQMRSQPIWLLMLIVPFGYVLVRDPGAFAGLTHYAGAAGRAIGFDLHLFGAALTVGIALITQLGEQADYLRFMPAQTRANRKRWWGGVLMGGPGWVVMGVLKMVGGMMLPTSPSATWCRPNARSTPTRCTWRPSSTSSRTTAGRSQQRRCSW